MAGNKGELRIWWIPQVPMKPFHIKVKNIGEAKLILNTLAEYDKFQFYNRIKPDYSNAGGLEIFNGEEWEEWHNEVGMDIDELLKEEIEESDEEMEQ